MRLLIHDYGGYPFPVQLSRALAARGHTVLHAYCGSLQTTPRGVLRSHPDDDGALEIKGLLLDEPLEKYAFVKRWRQENEYGRLIAREISRFRPDVVLSGNTPLDAQRRLLKACRATQTPFVFWVQDLIGLATHRLLSKKLPLAGHAVGGHYIRLERSMLRESDAVVVITENFRPIMEQYGVAASGLHVIENWAPLEEVPVHPKANAWAEAHGLADKTCLLYAGTLGMKHNPDLLLQLARRFRDRPDVRVVVVSQGLGADWLKAEKRRQPLPNLVVLGFQPFERLPEVLATADVLVAVLEPDAAVFSVPSKVLVYLCAARPVLLAVPPENTVAHIVEQHAAGRVVSPGDLQGFLAAAEALLARPDLRRELGRHGRTYAEAAFDIEEITRAFEAVFTDARRLRGGPSL